MSRQPPASTPAHRLRFPHQAGWAAGLTVLFAIGLDPARHRVLLRAQSVHDPAHDPRVHLDGHLADGGRPGLEPARSRAQQPDHADRLVLPGRPAGRPRPHPVVPGHARRWCPTAPRRRPSRSGSPVASPPQSGFLLLALLPTRHWNPRLVAARRRGRHRRLAVTVVWVGLYHTAMGAHLLRAGGRAHHHEGGDRVRAVRRVRGRGRPPAAPRPSRAQRRARLAGHGRLDPGAGRALLHPLRQRRRRLQPAGPCAQGRRLHHGVPGDLRRRRAGSVPSAGTGDVAAPITDRLRSRPHLVHRPGGSPAGGQPGVQLAVPRRARRRGRTQPRGRGVDRRPSPHPAPPAVRRRASASRSRCRTARASCSSSTPSRRRTSPPRASGSG